MLSFSVLLAIFLRPPFGPRCIGLPLLTLPPVVALVHLVRVLGQPAAAGQPEYCAVHGGSHRDGGAYLARSRAVEIVPVGVLVSTDIDRSCSVLTLAACSDSLDLGQQQVRLRVSPGPARPSHRLTAVP